LGKGGGGPTRGLAIKTSVRETKNRPRGRKDRCRKEEGKTKRKLTGPSKTGRTERSKKQLSGSRKKQNLTISPTEKESKKRKRSQNLAHGKGLKKTSEIWGLRLTTSGPRCGTKNFFSEQVKRGKMKKWEKSVEKGGFFVVRTKKKGNT